MALWASGSSAAARRLAGDAAAAAATPIVRDALTALQRRVTDGPMPATSVSEVFAAAPPRPAPAPPPTHPALASAQSALARSAAELSAGPPCLF
eukprot:gene12601-biopygen4784